jgi:hypothetical protein
LRANTLAEGEGATESFEYVVDDGAGRTATTTITFDITGENDAPSVTSAVLADDFAENGEFSPSTSSPARRTSTGARFCGSRTCG